MVLSSGRKRVVFLNENLHLYSHLMQSVDSDTVLALLSYVVLLYHGDVNLRMFVLYCSLQSTALHVIENENS